MNRSNGLLAAGLVLVLVVLRVATHHSEAIPNFDAAGALALFCGAIFRDWRLAFGVPLLGMMLADSMIEFDPSRVSVYAAIAGYVGIGLWVASRQRKPLAVLGGTLAGSLLFFVVTNFQFWLNSTPALGIYHTPHTLAGFVKAYAQALPFFRSTLVGDLFFSGVFFGAYAVAEALHGRKGIAPATVEPLPVDSLSVDRSDD